MISRTRPDLPIPPPLRGEEEDSFAYHSIVERLPRIGRRLLAENEFAPPVAEALSALLGEIPETPIKPLDAADAPDGASWTEYVAAQRQRDWLEVPWFFAEAYFYRRVVAATGYFGEGPGRGQDPFAPHKAQSLAASWAEAERLAQRVQSERAAGWDAKALPHFLGTALWGNKGDLSMWPGGADEHPDHDEASADDHLLVDEREALQAYVAQRGGKLRQVDFLMDNAALELIGDLALALFLLESGLTARVVLHMKPHPTFVSDTLPEDVRTTIRALVAADNDALVDLGDRLRDTFAQGRIQMRQHFFWTSPLPGWQMPGSLRATLARSDLVICKGDANYRRLLGDRHWPYSAPFAQIVSYFPASLLALRTLKSEVAAGIPAARVAQLNARDEPWTTSGMWGVIQFAARSSAPGRP